MQIYDDRYYSSPSGYSTTSYLPVSLETVTITSGTKINYGSFNNCIGIKSIVLPESVETISKKAFAGCTQLQEINLDQVRIIEANAFEQTDLINVCIPNVESIGNYAFDRCKKIKNIIFSDKITNIGEGAFRDCTSLSTLTLPVSVKSIGRRAFSGCDSLNEVYVEWSTPLALNSSILDDGVTVYVPRGCRTKYRQADFWRALNIKVKSLPLSELVLFEDPMVKSICIRYWDTDEDEELSKAEAASVTNLGKTFMGKSEITIFNELQYFTGLQRIDVNAFSNCYSLHSVVLPLCIKSVDSKAFYRTGLNGQLVIPDGVTDIGENAFYGCSNIKSIVFPSTCLFVGKAAFFNCTSLDTVLYLGTRQQWQSINILDDNDNLKDAHIVYEYGTLHQFEEFEQNEIRYVVTDLASRKLSVVEKPDKYKGMVIIPNVVSYFGVDYYVSGIADGAFENCNDIDSILYEGTRVQWLKLSIGQNNEILQAVPIRYAFESTGNNPHDNYVYIPDTSIPFAGNGTLSVCLRNQDPVTGYQFELELPAGVSIVTNNDACQASVSNDRTTLSDHNIFEVSKLKNGRYLVICASTKNSVFSGTDGIVATLDIVANEDAEIGYHHGYIYNQVIAGSTGVLDRIDISEFSFKVESYVLGDVNGDQTISVVDVNGAVNLILGNMVDGLVAQAADVNGDGSISVVDVNGIVNLIIYGNPLGSASSGKHRGIPSADVTLQVNSVAVAPGISGTANLVLGDAPTFSALQFDMRLPEGITVEAVGDNNHLVTIAGQEDGSIRIVCTSLSNTRFVTPNVLLLTFSATDTAMAGDHALTLDRIELSTPDMKAVHPDAITTGLRVDTVSTINSFGTDVPVRIYTLQGVEVHTSQLGSGIYIVNGNKLIIK